MKIFAALLLCLAGCSSSGGPGSDAINEIAEPNDTTRREMGNDIEQDFRGECQSADDVDLFVLFPDPSGDFLDAAVSLHVSWGAGAGTVSAGSASAAFPEEDGDGFATYDDGFVVRVECAGATGAEYRGTVTQI